MFYSFLTKKFTKYSNILTFYKLTYLNKTKRQISKNIWFFLSDSITKCEWSRTLVLLSNCVLRFHIKNLKTNLRFLHYKVHIHDYKPKTFVLGL